MHLKPREKKMKTRNRDDGLTLEVFVPRDVELRTDLFSSHMLNHLSSMMGM